MDGGHAYSAPARAQVELSFGGNANLKVYGKVVPVEVVPALGRDARRARAVPECELEEVLEVIAIRRDDDARVALRASGQRHAARVGIQNKPPARIELQRLFDPRIRARARCGDKQRQKRPSGESGSYNKLLSHNPLHSSATVLSAFLGLTV